VPPVKKENGNNETKYLGATYEGNNNMSMTQQIMKQRETMKNNLV
jgi:hypothetical protein